LDFGVDGVFGRVVTGDAVLVLWWAKIHYAICNSAVTSRNPFGHSYI